MNLPRLPKCCKQETGSTDILVLLNVTPSWWKALLYVVPPHWVCSPNVQKAIADTGVVKECRCLLQSTEQGARQLLLDSCDPLEVRSKGSYALEMGLTCA